jgi:hypothetical protein
MFCPKCGKENPDNVQLCQSCSWVISSVSHPPLRDAKTSGLAIASLVLSILGLFTCITMIPGIILGIVALVKIGHSAGRLKGTGMAIAGITVPVAAIPIIAMLAAILIPALVRTKETAYKMVCATNLSGLGKTMLLYAGDYEDKFPTSSEWCDLLIKYQNVQPEQFRCKASLEGPCNYAININLKKLSMSANPGTVLLFETTPGWNQAGGPEMLSTENHQDTGCNVVFIDTHVEFVRTEDLGRLRWTDD